MRSLSFGRDESFFFPVGYDILFLYPEPLVGNDGVCGFGCGRVYLHDHYLQEKDLLLWHH